MVPPEAQATEVETTEVETEQPAAAVSWPGAAAEQTPAQEGSEDETVEQVAAPAWGEQRPAWEMDMEGQAPTRVRPETYRTDPFVALAAGVLAASVFLPWYAGPAGFRISVSAWTSGTWGPIILFLAAGSFLLVALRRVGVGITLPIDESLIHELAGWISLTGAVIKSRFRPGPAGLLDLDYGLWVGIGAAIVLALVAGRMSPHAPLVFQPGWYRGRAGKLGLAVLLAIVGGSAAFGAINSTKLVPSTSGPQTIPGVVRGRLPDCIKEFPVPTGVSPVQGTDTPCLVQFSSSRPPADVVKDFRAALQAKGWTFTTNDQLQGSVAFSLTKPRCGSLVVVGAPSGSYAVLQFAICQTPGPTSSPTTTRSPSG